MLDFNKPMQIPDGRPVRVLATDVKGDYPIVVAIPRHNPHKEAVFLINSKGQCSPITLGGTLLRVTNVPEEHTVWVNMYPVGGFRGLAYSSRQAAEEGARADRIACIKVTYKEGEGLDNG